MATIKLKTNIPVVGTVRYIDYYPAKPNPKNPAETVGPDLGLKGSWTMAGLATEGTIYVPGALLTELLTQGLATQAGVKDNVPQLRWAYTGPVQILKEEVDGRKKHTSVTAVGAPPIAPAAPALQHPAAVPPAAMPASATPAPASAPSDGRDPVEAWWADQVKLMRYCYAAARFVHERVPTGPERHTGDEDPPVTIEEINATAHSFYIQANREGRLAPKTWHTPVKAPSAPAPVGSSRTAAAGGAR
jgi:hypothetical protein